jgi:GTP-binding protein
MFVDDITIRVRAGDGGKGAVAFNKNLNQYGPAGGSGGDGGDVYVEGSSDFSILASYRFKKEFAAKSGENGRPQFRDGVTAEHLVLYVPVGTVVHNLTKGTDEEVVSVGERIRVARGGHGGRGNFHFRSSTNRRPKQFELGTPGEHFSIRFELKLIADVGFIGLPNVGKSSLLNELTRAKSKVANYEFTTLEPNLGIYYELVLADIPGLIEGASGGKGLGIKFLRHIERTNTLFHIISAESEDPGKEYAIVRKELGLYNPVLLKKKEYVFLGKSDMVSAPELKQKMAALKKLKLAPKALSIHDFDAIERVKKILNTLIKGKLAKKRVPEKD